MIAIRRSNLNDICEEHYQGVKYWCESALEVYIRLFDAIHSKCIGFLTISDVQNIYSTGLSNSKTTKLLRAITENLSNTEKKGDWDETLTLGIFNNTAKVPQFYRTFAQELNKLLTWIKKELENIITNNYKILKDIEIKLKAEVRRITPTNPFIYHTQFVSKWDDFLYSLISWTKQELIDTTNFYKDFFVGLSNAIKTGNLNNYTQQNFDTLYNTYPNIGSSNAKKNKLIKFILDPNAITIREANYDVTHLHRNIDVAKLSNLQELSNLFNTITSAFGTTPPSDFEDFYKRLLNEAMLSPLMSSITIQDSYKPEFKTLIEAVFDYESWANKGTELPKNAMGSERWGAYDLAKKLKVSVCPYCNRNYTLTVTEDQENIIRPDFDHFFDKAKHPLFRLSFYNLIPSCKICNSTLKNQKKTTLDNNLHPYDENGYFGKDAVFKYSPQPNNTFKLELSILTKDPAKKKRIEGNRNLFRLEKIYQEHQDIISDIIDRKKKYSENYFKSIGNQFLLKIFSSKEEYYHFVFHNYYKDEDFENRPFAKLTRDLYDQRP